MKEGLRGNEGGREVTGREVAGREGRVLEKLDARVRCSAFCFDLAIVSSRVHDSDRRRVCIDDVCGAV